MGTDAERYRREAERATHYAEKARSPEAKAHWQRIAEGYLRLAKRAEGRDGDPPARNNGTAR